MAGVIHIAGVHITVNAQLRQRCAWCGAVLLDYDLAHTLSPCDDDCHTSGCKPENHQPATWPAGELVKVDGNATILVPHEDGAPLPAHACAQLPAEVTV